MEDRGTAGGGHAELRHVNGTIFMMPFAGDPGYGYASLLPPFGHPSRAKFRQITLPGHGERLAEPLLESLEMMAGDIFRQIANEMRTGDVFYGHSMGALLAWLVLRRARTMLFPLPRAVILSGMRAPSTLVSKGRHELSADGLRDELRRLGGSPDAVLNDDDVFRFFEPQVRADFKAVETFRYRAEPPLPMRASILIGDADDVSHDDACAWRQEFVTSPSVESLSGGHFFIFQHAAKVRALLADALLGQGRLVNEAAR